MRILQRFDCMYWSPKRGQKISYSYKGFLGGTANSSSLIAHAWARTHASIAFMAASMAEEVPKKGRDDKCRVEAGRERKRFQAKSKETAIVYIYMRARYIVDSKIC